MNSNPNRVLNKQGGIQIDGPCRSRSKTPRMAVLEHVVVDSSVGTDQGV
jgi:hypothetical protein